MVERVRFEACRCGWDASQSGGGNCFLDRVAQHETSVSSASLSSPNQCRLQPSRRDRIFPFFGRHQFRRLGSRDCRPAPSVAVANPARRHRNSGVLCRRFRYRDWAREIRWCSANRAEAAAKAYADSLFLGGTLVGGRRTLEPDWDSVGLAVRSAGSGWRTQRAAMVAVLHSKKDRSRARIGRHRQKLCLDHRGGNLFARFHFRVGTRDYFTSLETAQSECVRLRFGSPWASPQSCKSRANYGALPQGRAERSVSVRVGEEIQAVLRWERR